MRQILEGKTDPSTRECVTGEIPEETGVKQKSEIRTTKLEGIVFLLALACAGLAACSNGGADAKPGAKSSSPFAGPAPVSVAQAVTMNVPVQLTEIGSVEPYSTVSVESQVDGVIQRAYFKPGQFVRAGSLLFTIDPQPFQVALQQAQANLAKDQAQAANAEAEAARYTELYKAGIVSQDQFETYKTNAAALLAAVRADKAAVLNAKIQLGYCWIRSPIAGRTGAVLVQPGNLIKNNSAALVTINQVQPIYADFYVPQSQLPEINQDRALHPLRVEAIVPHDTAHPQWGTLTFINNTVDAATGTILLKGTFANPDRVLWPGQFVNVVLTLSNQPNAVVVPSAVIQTGQHVQYAYVVQPDNTVALRMVKTGATVDGETVVDQGIKSGETVVTDGQLRLYPGAKISIKTGESGNPAPGGAPPAAKDAAPAAK